MRCICSFTLTMTFIGSLIISSTTFGSTAVDCRQSLKVAVPQILTQESIKIMAWNLKNVFTHQGEFQREGLNEMKRVKGGSGLPQAKPMWEVRASRDIIAKVMPDIGVLTEIEDVQSVRKLLEEDPRLRNVYHILLKEGNDPRGIDIATVIRKDLGLRYKLDSHKDLKWKDRFQVGKNWKEEVGPVFSRDLPAVRLYRPGEETPFFIIIGNHGKSKRDREGDPESQRWRTVQYDHAAKIIKKYIEQYPGVMIGMAGDFNTDVMNGFEMNSLREDTQSAFDMVPKEKQIPPKKRATHSFFPRGGSPKHTMMDDIRFTGNVEVLDAQFIDFLDKNGKPLGLPQSFEEREKKQPSDHKPVIAIIKNKI